METKYQKEVKRIIYKAEIAQLKKENSALMLEIKKNAGTIAVLNRDNDNLEKKLKAQIASTGEIIELQTKQNKRKNAAYSFLVVALFVLGFILGVAI